jgi:hypothetical protein
MKPSSAAKAWLPVARQMLAAWQSFVDMLTEMEKGKSVPDRTILEVGIKLGVAGAAVTAMTKLWPVENLREGQGPLQDDAAQRLISAARRRISK